MFQRICASGCAQGPVSQPEMDANGGVSVPTTNRKRTATLQRMQAVEAMGIAMGGDDSSLVGDDRVGFF